MDIDNSLWMDTLINKLERKARDRRDSLKGYWKGDWEGYSSTLSPMLGTEESIRNDIRRRERMAEAMYDI